MLNNVLGPGRRMSMRLLGVVAALGFLSSGALAEKPTDAAPQQVTVKDGQMVPDVAALDKEGELKDHVIGKADAPVTIIEYSSLTCGHCGHYHRTMFPVLKKDYVDTGKVRYIIREYPLDNLAVAGFMLARCKGDQFNKVVSDLYHTQDSWAYVDNPLKALKAQALKEGFTDESFMTCLRDQSLLNKIVKSADRAGELFDVNSTPTLFINGRMLRGPRDVKQIETMVDAAMKKPDAGK